MNQVRLVYLAGLLPALAIGAAEIPAGTVVEVRQTSSIGTRSSHPGDKISAKLINPLVRDGRTVIPAGATVEGEVTSVKKLGFGFRHSTASMCIRFHTFRLPGSRSIPLEARLASVDTAKEWVDGSGRIHGIRPNTNASSSLAVAAWRLILIAPPAGGPVWLTKLLLAPAPDTEIKFPAGTEYRLELTSPVEVEPEAAAGLPAAPLPPKSAEAVSAVVESLPSQRAQRKSGEPADLINLMVLGSREQIGRAFQAAGWETTARKTPLSVARTYFSVIERNGYRNAPMATMIFGGVRQTLDYQKSLNTFARRHHLRMWELPQRVDGRPAWVIAATEDIGIMFSRRSRGAFTHRIDDHVDHERTKVVDDLLYTGCVESAELLERPGLPARVEFEKPGGLHTDGKLAVLSLNDCARPVAMPGVGLQAGRSGAAKRAAGSLRNELVRSNFVSLAYNATRLSTATKSLLAGRQGRSAPAAALTRQQSEWLSPKTGGVIWTGGK